MILNKESKKVAELQILRLENSLIDIKAKTNNNSALFKIVSIPYIDRIRVLRSEIEEFIGVTNSEENSDLIIRISGEEIGKGKAPSSIVINSLSNFKSSITNTYANILGITNLDNIPKAIKDICDFSLVGTLEGSIQLVLEVPEDSNTLFSDEELFKTINIIQDVSYWALKQGSKEELEEIIPDNELSIKILNNVLKLTPSTEDSKIHSIQLYGNLITKDKELILTKETRSFIKDFIKEVELDTIQITGVIREIDLDKKSFILRDVNIEGLKEVHCKYNEQINSVKLNTKVLVTGIEKSRRTKISKMVLTHVENL